MNSDQTSCTENLKWIDWKIFKFIYFELTLIELQTIFGRVYAMGDVQTGLIAFALKKCPLYVMNDKVKAPR